MLKLGIVIFGDQQHKLYQRWHKSNERVVFSCIMLFLSHRLETESLFSLVAWAFGFSYQHSKKVRSKEKSSK